MEIVAKKPPLVNPSLDEVRVAMQLANQVLWASDPRNRRCAYAGKSWGDFKKAVEQLGVTDTTDLGSIEFGGAMYGSGYIVANDDDFGAADIREMRP